jgi:hypothetical protein
MLKTTKRLVKISGIIVSIGYTDKGWTAYDETDKLSLCRCFESEESVITWLETYFSATAVDVESECEVVGW